MKFMLIFLFCLPVFVCSSGAGYAQGSSVRLKVLCYNIRFGELASLEELAAFIKAQNPDVVALQELDWHTYRPAAPHQNGKDFITELGFRTGMLSAYGKTIPYMGGYYGIGILSKYPLSSIERIYLPKTGATTEQRALLVADVEYAEGQYFTFACTHLDNTNAEELLPQTQKLNEVLQARPYPVIVAGDFNARPSNVAISSGMSAWRMLCNSSPTSPASNPSGKIDYIFGFPSDRWTGVEAATFNNIQLSDHLPVSAVADLKR